MKKRKKSPEDPKGLTAGDTMRSETEITRAMERYADTVRRVCFMHLKNPYDTEDIFQSVFLKYMLSDQLFESSEHEKAWFIRVTGNACKDLLKSFAHRNIVPLEAVSEMAIEDEEESSVLEAVLSLPVKYREVIYLHYYEGYTAAEAGRILGKKENTVYTLLARARKNLKDKLKGEYFYE